MNRLADIQIEQVLHGYRNGHTEVASSINLPASAKKLMGLLSDATSSARQKTFGDYYTGYPLVDTRYFAFAKTWYADEMPRPGCVWTQTLLIPFDAALFELSRLLDLFSRPSLKAYDGYASSLTLSATSFQPNEARGEENLPLRRDIERLLFGLEDEAIFIAASENKPYERLILDVWLRLWKGASRWLTFCTGAVAPRYIGKKLFDLEIVYKRNALEAIKGNESIAAFDPESGGLLPNRKQSDMFYLPDDAKISNGESSLYNEILRQLGGVFTKRQQFFAARLLELLTNRRISNLNDYRFLSDLLHHWEIGTKKVIFDTVASLSENGRLVNEMAVDEYLFAALTEANKEDYVDDKSLGKLVTQYFPTRIDRLAKLLLAISETEHSSLGTKFLQVVAEQATEADIEKLSFESERLIPLLVDHRPELALRATVWNGSREAKYAIWHALKKPKQQGEFYRNLLAIFIGTGVDEFTADVDNADLAPIAVSQAFALASASVYENIRRTKWLDLLKRHKREYFELIDQAKEINYWQGKQVLDLIADDSASIADLSFSGQQKILDVFGKGRRLDDHIYFGSYLLAASLLGKTQEPVQVIKMVFPDIHRAAQESDEYFPGWHLLRPVCPARKRSRDWDKCERLRIALILFARESGNSLDDIVRAFGDQKLSKYIEQTRRKLNA